MVRYWLAAVLAVKGSWRPQCHRPGPMRLHPGRDDRAEIQSGGLDYPAVTGALVGVAMLIRRDYARVEESVKKLTP